MSNLASRATKSYQSNILPITSPQVSTSKLTRRGISLGTIALQQPNDTDQINMRDLSEAWHSGNAFKISAVAKKGVAEYAAALTESSNLYRSIIEQQDLDSLLAKEPYESRLAFQFEALGSSFNEGNPQEIETVFFDAVDDSNIVAEDLWVKVSWLSFDEVDNSLRFRFSFGVDFEEDVASDKQRQHFAAELAEAIFRESKIITSNAELIELLCKTLHAQSIQFVERIIYFNAPNGGAYLHHDRERGHAGVVYAQLTGSTFWLALPRKQLVQEVRTFINRCALNTTFWPIHISSESRLELESLLKDEDKLIEELESFNNSSLIQLINETENFIQTLVHRGYGKLLRPGDVILLPQDSENLCCWHSVFCVGEDPGEALSFAVRAS